MERRRLPNFLVTGTPGVGKSTFCQQLVDASGSRLLHIEIARLVEEKQLWDERDEERDCSIYDETLLDDELRHVLAERPEGGVVFDFHEPKAIPKGSVDFVFVLLAPAVLRERLLARGYSEGKVMENEEAEQMEIIRNEVVESKRYSELVRSGRARQVRCATDGDLEEAVARTLALVQAWEVEGAWAQGPPAQELGPGLGADLAVIWDELS